MKAEELTPGKRPGEIRLVPESLDDLWHIAHLVGQGDLVFATTFRSAETASDKLRPEKAEKKPVRLGIRVEKVEFHPSANRLRISGTIEHGVDLGNFHTINLEPGIELSVIRDWRDRDRERIQRAVGAASASAVHIAAIEEGEAEMYRIRQFGPQLVTSILGGSGKREGDNSREQFFADIKAILETTTGPIVIAGPGFVKDDFLRYLSRTSPGTAERSLVAETRRIGRGAVQEVIGQGVLDKIAEDIQLAREVRVIDELIARIGQDRGLVAYGPAEVAEAVEFGAAATVIVADTLLRDPEVNLLLNRAEERRAEVAVLSTEFEPGERLLALGGLAALLRFSIK